LQSSTGAAGNWFWVNTPAAAAWSSATIRARSERSR
jgi:hypothetical protein